MTSEKPAPAASHQLFEPVTSAHLEMPLTASEAAYVAAARAPNTRRGYASDWREFSTWCLRAGHEPLPAAPEALSGYITELAGAGAKVGTISRRLSSIRFVHLMRDLPDPTDAHEAAGRDAAERLRPALAALRPEDRLIVTMLHLEERSVADIAAVTGWSIANVKVRALRARQKLKDFLVRHEKSL